MQFEASQALLTRGPSRSGIRGSDELIWRDVQKVIESCCLRPRRLERRVDRRVLFPFPVLLTPLLSRDIPAEEEKFSVIGKHLADCGLDFYHKRPLPFRRVIASLPCGPEAVVRLLLDLRWCRFGHHGWYESGGRFLQAAPLLADSDVAPGSNRLVPQPTPDA